MPPALAIQPSLDAIRNVLESTKGKPNPPNLVPLCTSLSAEFLTPSSIYLKVAAKSWMTGLYRDGHLLWYHLPNSTSWIISRAVLRWGTYTHKSSIATPIVQSVVGRSRLNLDRSKSKSSFLFESAATTETIGRYSFIGADPRKIIKSGPGHGIGEKDPLPVLEAELSQYLVATVPGLVVTPLIGGAIGFVGYDCVRYFEPRTKRDMVDVLKVPESLFMLFDTIVAVDHFFQQVKIFTYLKVPSNLIGLEKAYQDGKEILERMVTILKDKDIPLPPQGPIELNQTYTSNIGQKGYEAHVTKLKEHISKGDIIQAVPSQRIARPTSLHPFNIYRNLRTVNPSPYLFFVDCEEFQIIGASPEVLVKSEQGRIITHPIAGTVWRGKNAQEDEALAEQLRSSLKDRAEHVMLVDLARNDVNRVCDPLSTRVDRLMVVQKFSHVQHLVSEVSGILRPDKSRFDAFRSIFPAGTVSGAPKVRAMELIAELEKEKRGIYAGAVGYFGYNTSSNGKVEEGAMDTCIALRTMLYKDGIAYLQAGGGIVFDSNETEEYEETMNKAKSNITCINTAEAAHFEEQQITVRAG